MRNEDGTPFVYDKGNMVVRNGMDKFRFLVDHKGSVASAIGVKTSDISENIRDLGKVKEYLARQGGVFDLG